MKIREVNALLLQLLLGLTAAFLVVMIWYTSNTSSYIPSGYIKPPYEYHKLRRDVSQMSDIDISQSPDVRTSFLTRTLFKKYNETMEKIVTSMFDEYHPLTRNNTLPFMKAPLQNVDQITTLENETKKGDLIEKNDTKKEPQKPPVGQTDQKISQQEYLDTPRPDDKPRRIYLEHGTGRLGNKLFHIAAAYSIAMANNLTLYVPYDTEVIRIFNVTQFKTYTAKDYADFAKSGAKIQPIKHISYNSSFMNLTWKYHVKLHKGGVQTYMYFWTKYQPHIRSLYVFNKFIQYQVNAFLHGLQQKYSKLGNVTYVGIHCRRGDRAYDPAVINAGYKATPKAYFQKAIDLTLTRYKTPIIYVVATDDRGWTTENLRPPGKNTFIEHTPYGLTAEYDMGILSSMNHTIMSTGSFGWWCSYLAGGDVIYYNNPFVPKTTRGKSWKRYFKNEMYPKEKNWISMG
ncbi:unnamed protein product [Owenia fusiformis]|uniref:L-Fucosyltransferase n=1 Tax=Owenia fusiformis TaxID=6347 RepID=A0A8J1XUC5_OWEFU|nr:unnamed protein product [Owenia fusiformis]